MGFDQQRPHDGVGARHPLGLWGVRSAGLAAGWVVFWGTRSADRRVGAASTRSSAQLTPLARAAPLSAQQWPPAVPWHGIPQHASVCRAHLEPRLYVCCVLPPVLGHPLVGGHVGLHLLAQILVPAAAEETSRCIRMVNQYQPNNKP